MGDVITYISGTKNNSFMVKMTKTGTLYRFTGEMHELTPVVLPENTRVTSFSQQRVTVLKLV